MQNYSEAQAVQGRSCADGVSAVGSNISVTYECEPVVTCLAHFTFKFQ